MDSQLRFTFLNLFVEKNVAFCDEILGKASFGHGGDMMDLFGEKQVGLCSGVACAASGAVKIVWVIQKWIQLDN